MLTDIAIKSAIREAKTAGKPLKRFDEKGLYLLIKPNGAALWRLKYVFGVKKATAGKRKGKLVGIEKGIGLGAYEDVPLKRAREKRDEARKLVADGVDPSAVRKAQRNAMADSVEALAREWLDKRDKKVSAGTARRDRLRFEKYIFPTLGKRPISSVEPPELLAALRRIEALEFRETAHRTLAACGRVWRYAIVTGRAKRDITSDLRDALEPSVVTSFAAITDPKKVGELLRAIEGYSGQPTVRCALKLGPMLFVRPGELRHAEWTEFDVEGAEPIWRIPAAKMKMKDPHVVPLAKQAVTVLRDLESHSGNGKYVFPSLRSGARPMSENTVNAALRRLGYPGTEQVGHGFRTIASTLLNELGWDPDAIELQLAHKEGGVRPIYNRAVLLQKRREMMQAWADHLDSLRVDTGGKNAAAEATAR
jgi:integrase